MAAKLRLALVLSIAVCLTAVSQGAAHEVIPSVADLRMETGRVEVDIRLNAEALVLGLDLDGVEDTNEIEGSDDYDRLRTLPPEDLAQMLRDDWPRIREGMVVRREDGTAIPLEIGEVSVSEIGDIELPRVSRMVASGDLPPEVQAVTFTWGEGNGTLILRHVGVQEGFAGYLDGGETSPPLARTGQGAMGPAEAFAAYIPVGFTHILPKGLDHILFVLGLFFLSPHWRPLLWQVSAFTVAHTVTLALGALGLANAPPQIVEPLIALSIAFIAVENLFSSTLHRWRPFVVFAFGLLHGLGFASVLTGVGLPQSQLIPALLGFNVGVELGQLAVIAVAFLAVAVWFREESWYRTRIAMPVSAVIGIVGLYWFVERAFL